MAKKTTKVMWASKHEPEQAQLRELRRLFGEDVAVDNYPNRIQGGQELYRILISQNYDELVLLHRKEFSYTSRNVQFVH